jgi:2-polyprenyl-6-hydroxyphenyl methylase/3-demethylubiquinone-9 3-methyltransferase
MTAATKAEAYWFGKNWRRYLDETDADVRTREAVSSLTSLFGRDALAGKTFLDIGCGSGLFSLAALALGAERVVSIDVDPDSVECCRSLVARAQPGPGTWTVLHGSILDRTFVERLPRADVVYSWGVLHHTGDMWTAIENAGSRVAPGGKLLIGIYNWRGGRRGTVTWQKLKRWYCAAPPWQRQAWEWAYIAWNLGMLTAKGRNPVAHVRSYHKQRGMSWFRDVSDWLGGYPYEAATPGEVLAFVRERFGFELTGQTIADGLGVSEFLFEDA